MNSINSSRARKLKAVPPAGYGVRGPFREHTQRQSHQVPPPFLIQSRSQSREKEKENLERQVEQLERKLQEVKKKLEDLKG